MFPSKQERIFRLISVLSFLIALVISLVWLKPSFSLAQSANRPPSLLLPNEVNTKEGELFVVPITVNMTEPENDSVTYSAFLIDEQKRERILPAWLGLKANPKTAEQDLVGWIPLDAAGVYTLRVGVEDEHGAATKQDLILRVADRIGQPAIKVNLPDRRFIAPDSVQEFEEKTTFKAEVEVDDPEGEVVSLQMSGLPEVATLTQSDAKRYSISFSITSAGHPHVGTHSVVLKATDASGKATSFAFSLDVRRVLDFQDEAMFVAPELKSGLARTLGTGTQAHIVRGPVTLGLRSQNLWHASPVPLPEEARYRYVLYIPDEKGNAQKRYLSDVLTSTKTFTWNSTDMPDGVYAIGVELLDGGHTQETDISRFYSRASYFVVDNVPGPASVEYLPIIGGEGQRGRWAEQTEDPSFIPVPKQGERHTSRPLRPRFVPAPQTNEGRERLVGEKKFISYGVFHNINSRFWPMSEVARTSEGHLLVDVRNYRTSVEQKVLWRHHFYDGERNQALINKGSSIRSNPNGPGYFGISLEGRFFKGDWQGQVETLAGYVNRPDVYPYLTGDGTVTEAVTNRDTRLLRGQFDNNELFFYPRDLVADPGNPDRWYIADTRKNRIALVEIKGGSASVSTFAGKPGTAGNQDGSLVNARFNAPVSVEVVGEKLFVADQGNNALRAIDLKTGEVKTVVSGDSIKGINWVRRFSNGELVALIERDPAGKGNLRRINVDAESVTPIAANLDLEINHMEVDWQGNVGPVDDLIVAGANGDHDIGRISSDGQYTKIFGDDGFPNKIGEGLAGDGGAYAQNLFIDNDNDPEKREARFCTIGGQYQRNLICHEAIQSGDEKRFTLNIDTDLSSSGRSNFIFGTVEEFHPAFDRPSMAAVFGRRGVNQLGNQPTFDDLTADLPLSELVPKLAKYVRAGMGTGVPRPELTGRDLQGVIYYILLFSQRAFEEQINPQVIGDKLREMGLYDDDLRQSEIRNIQVAEIRETANGKTYEISWQTDEPTFGIVEFGNSQNYGLNRLETVNANVKEHRVILENLDSERTHYFRIRAKDVAGNQTVSIDRLLSGQLAPPPPSPLPRSPLPTQTPAPSPVPAVSFFTPTSGQIVARVTPLPLGLQVRSATLSSCIRFFLDGAELTTTQVQNLTSSGESLPLCQPTVVVTPAPTESPVPGTPSPSPSPQETPVPTLEPTTEPTPSPAVTPH